MRAGWRQSRSRYDEANQRSEARYINAPGPLYSGRLFTSDFVSWPAYNITGYLKKLTFIRSQFTYIACPLRKSDETNMSWSAYITSMTGGNTVAEACIAGLDGNVWAKSDGINPSPQELQTIIAGFTNADTLRQNGVRLGGEKYIYLQSDESSIQAKKATSGLSIAKANTCILIGLYRDGQQPGNCRKTIDAMRDYLVQNKY